MLKPEKAILDEPPQTELTRTIPTHRCPPSLQCWEAIFENKQSHTFQKHPPTKASPALKGGRWEAN